MLVHYQSCLIAIGLFPEYAGAFRFNSITRKDCIYCVYHPDAITLIISTGDMTVTPPANTGLAENFKVAYSLDYSFKKYVKRDASIILLLRKGNIGTLRGGMSSPLPEYRT